MIGSHKCARCHDMIQSGFICRTCMARAVYDTEHSAPPRESRAGQIRAAALEEAALIAEAVPDSGISTLDDVEREHAAKIAAAIRAAIT